MNLAALDDRIVREALDILRRESAEQETASRLYRVCEQAVAARYATFARLPVAAQLRLAAYHLGRNT